MKGYKVTDRFRIRLVGVACDSLRQLKTKGAQRLTLEESVKDVVVALDDGTIVDDEDYFQTLPAQTTFVLYRKDDDVITGVNFILDVLRRVNSSYLDTGLEAKKFLLTKTKELMKIMKEDKGEEYKILRNTPQEDPEWFSDLDTNAKTKDDYMFRKSQDRIRGYLYKFQDDVRKSRIFLNGDHRSRKTIEDCFGYFRKRLKDDRYFGCYFDRRCATIYRKGPLEEPERKKVRGEEQLQEILSEYDKSSYCDDSGKFVCQGRWTSPNCDAEHQINPYLSKETRILFSTWNLDHRIERSRSVVPTFVSTVQACKESQSVNFLYFYQLLFTKLNLKLVHVICHDKSIHDVICDSRLLYT